MYYYVPNSMVKAVLENLIAAQLIWKFLAFMEYKVHDCVRGPSPEHV
jgi:hypothetical protein